MPLGLSLSAKLGFALIAVSGVGVAVLPADLGAVSDAKTASSVSQPEINFTIASIPAAVETAPVRSPALQPKSTAGARITAVTQVQAAAPAKSNSTPAKATRSKATELKLDRVNATVNVRAAGRTGSPVLFVLPAGTEVEVSRKENGWVYIHSSQGEGWIYSRFVGAPAASSTPKAKTSSTDKEVRPTDKEVRSTDKMVRVMGDVSVYERPGGVRVYRLEAGERIRILEIRGKWGRIATVTGEGGWVRLR